MERRLTTKAESLSHQKHNVHNDAAILACLSMIFFISKIREMSSQRFSLHGEHTHTPTFVAVSLHELIQDCMLSLLIRYN